VQVRLALRLLLPPCLRGDTASIASERSVPVFATTDPAILHVDGTNRAFHLIMGARTSLDVVPLDEPWPQMRYHLAQMASTLFFVFGSFFGIDTAAEPLSVGIAAPRTFHIGALFRLTGP
jgi:hypothetical protein